MSQITWKDILCTKRQRDSSAKKQGQGNIVRNEFEADYDRIVGSSSVRRLQDKAQVYPLQENDVVRTRLTHSLEVSALARSLGKAVGKQLERILGESFNSEMTDQLAGLLQTAGLIHDLGNPPFGHYGEVIIREWFDKWFESREYKELNIKLDEQEKNDFIFFDGNVQNIRIVTKLQTLNDAFGANFTYATIATIIKYPWKSNDEIVKSKKKFGCFKSEENLMQEIWNEIGLKEGQRHPVTYLLEAADDIIYLCDDIEDGVKKTYIDWDEEFKILKENNLDKKNLFNLIEQKEPDVNMGVEEIRLAKARNFRNYIQSYLFSKVITEFITHHDDILNGSYINHELLDCEKIFVEQLKEITKKRCFGCHEVVALELVGDKVVHTLLDIFVPTILKSDIKDLIDIKTYAGKVYSLISSNFKYIAEYNYNKKEKRELEQLTAYDKLHLIIDFVSGMTDSYAVNLYKELMGMRIPAII